MQQQSTTATIGPNDHIHISHFDFTGIDLKANRSSHNLVEATPKEYRELTRLQALKGRTWNLPALAGGRAFVRNHLEMACYDLRADR